MKNEIGHTIVNPLDMSQTAIAKRRNHYAVKSTLDHTTQAIETMQAFNPIAQDADLSHIEDLFGERMTAVIEHNDMKELEAILLSQAATLNNIFHALAQNAASQCIKNPEHMKSTLDRALKVQKQSVRTLEVLANLKQPKPTHLIQNNMVQQQVINNPPSKTETNELLSYDPILDA